MLQRYQTRASLDHLGSTVAHAQKPQPANRPQDGGGDFPLRLPSRLLCSLGLGILLLSSGPAWSQAQDKYDLGLGFQGGAALEATAVQNNNFFYEPSRSVSATGYRVRPSVAIARAGSAGRFNLDADVEQSNFDLPGDLDHYLDYSARSNYLWQPFRRHRLDIAGAFRHGHDPAGLQRTESLPNFSRGEIDRWNLSSGFLTYRYGADESLGSNVLSVGQNKRRYTTNRDQTVFLDYTSRVIDYELAYEYSPKTAVIFHASRTTVDYVRPVLSGLGNRNGSELIVRTGLRWTATGKTSGEVQLGVRDYSFDGRTRAARQSFGWKANIVWAPTPLTELRLRTGQVSTETFRTDTFYIDERSAALSWHQTWTPRFGTDAGARYVNSKFVGANRTDEYLNIDLGFDYLLARKASVFGQYLSRNRDSTLATREYDAPEVRLGIRLTL